MTVPTNNEDRPEELIQDIAELLGGRGYELNSHEETADLLVDIARPWLETPLTETEMAVLDLPDTHSLEDRVSAREKWHRYSYEAGRVLSAALGGGK